MEVRDATRQQPWLAACPVAPESFEQVRPRLATFLVPCGETCCRQARPQPAPPSLGGLLAEVARTKVAASASRFGQDRLPLPRCMGWAPWEAGPVRQELTRQVAAPLGPAAGGWVFDPAGCPTSGPASGGGWRASGAAAGARSTPVKSPAPGAPGRAWALPGSTGACLCPTHGPRTRPASPQLAAPRPQRVSLAAPVGVGQVADQWQAASAWVERWRGREGASVWVSALACGLGRALDAGGAGQPVAARPGDRPPGGARAGAASAASRATRRRVEGLAGRGRLEAGRRARRLPRAAGGRRGHTPGGGTDAPAATRRCGATRRATRPRPPAGRAGGCFAVPRRA
jgi:hypothetical protein